MLSLVGIALLDELPAAPAPPPPPALRGRVVVGAGAPSNALLGGIATALFALWSGHTLPTNTSERGKRGSD